MINKGRNHRRKNGRNRGKVLILLMIGLLITSGFIFRQYFFEMNGNDFSNTNTGTDDKDLAEDTKTPSGKPQTSEQNITDESEDKRDDKHGIGQEGRNDEHDSTQNDGQNGEQNETSNNEQVSDKIREQVNKMTLREKIGQMVIVGFEGYTIDDNVKKMIDIYKVGGFILFGRNVENSEQLLALNNSLKKANSQNKIPLFISVDEEGGIVSRMPGEFKKLPSNKVIGKMNNEDLSFKIGYILAEELSMFGFNMNFAPVLDINSNPQNPVIGDRSFGDNAEIVSKLGVQTMKGIRSGGVIPVVKHFPGHGDTSEDSHIGLPVVNHDLSRIMDFELIPFKNAIDNQADAIMIAHILLKNIDSENPSSLSSKVVTDLLRKQLGFEGVIVTDDMTMGAITENYNLGEAAVKAVNAGCDIILVCHGYNNQVAVINALLSAAENNMISNNKIDESVYRILMLKDKYGLSESQRNPIDSDVIRKINEKIDNVFGR